jgi:o-succinylbenzoate synthase
MANAALSFERRNARLEPPLWSAGGLHEQRELLIVKVQRAEGDFGFGEASPLPGYSRGSVAECEHTLQALPPWQLSALASLESSAEILESVSACVPDGVPAARFALETALLDRLSRGRGAPVSKLLGELLGQAPRPIGLCALLGTEDPELAARRVELELSTGVRTFKVKIGPERFTPSQQSLLRGLRARFGADFELRLDANQSLRRETIAQDLAAIAEHQPQFLEEPLLGLTPDEARVCPCPLGFDESLQDMPVSRLRAFLALPRAAVLVLKPTALGGIHACIRLAQLARALGHDVVVSHTLEGPVGWAACVHLALALGGGRAAGLAPLSHQAVGHSLGRGRLEVATAPGLGVQP